MKTDSKTKNGITVGLIDSIITVASVLSKRGDLHDQDSAAVREAMNDLTSDDNVSWLLTRKTAKQWANDREAISIAVKALSAPSTHSSSEMVEVEKVVGLINNNCSPYNRTIYNVDKLINEIKSLYDK